DNCGTVTPTGVEGAETLVSGCTYQTIKTWTAVDACNNSSTAQQTVTYTKDATPPVITITQTPLPPGCNPTAAGISAALGSATATDGCGTPILNQSDGTITSTGCSRSQTR